MHYLFPIVLFVLLPNFAFGGEDTKPAPSTVGGEARLDAVAKRQKLCNAELFRAAGIYSPGAMYLMGY